jgi:hypothetical protein
MNPKHESEELMNEMLPVAKRMLREYGEFFPYGGYMKPSGEMVHVGAKDPETDRPKSKELIAILQGLFQEMARNKQCKAVAIVYDVIIPLPKSNRRGSAIQVCLEHAGNYSAEVFIPYQIVNREVLFGEIFAQKGSICFLTKLKCRAKPAAAGAKQLSIVGHAVINQPPLNKIRPISPTNPKLPMYQDAAKTFLEQP